MSNHANESQAAIASMATWSRYIKGESTAYEVNESLQAIFTDFSTDEFMKVIQYLSCFGAHRVHNELENADVTAEEFFQQLAVDNAVNNS